jgi:hypothetical protein
MKKHCILLAFMALVNVLAAQNQNDESKPMMDDFEKMQRQMMKRFENFFKMDSTEGFTFRMDTTFNLSDSSFNRSFGFMFDGKEWKQFTPDGSDSTDFKSPFGSFFQGMPDVFKDFDKFFSDDFMSPRVRPYGEPDRRRKGDTPSKEKKYQTEKL